MTISFSGLKGAFFNVYSAYEEFIGLGSETIDDSQISERDTLSRTSSIINRYVFFIFLLPVLPPLPLFPNAEVIDVEMGESTRSGDLTEEEIDRERVNSLEVINDHLNKQGLPLRSDRRHQLEERNSLNRKNIGLLLNRVGPDATLFKKLVDSIDIIKMREFSLGLILCAKTLNEKLDLNREYAVGIRKGKSQTWVTELVLPFLEKMPARSFNIAVDSWAASSVREKLGTNITQFVVFDDASYTGSQIETTVKGIKEIAYERFGYKRCELYLVVPFVSSTALNLLKKTSAIFDAYGNLGVTLITTNRRIKMIKEIFPKEELKACVNSNNEDQKWLANHLNSHSGTLTHCEWKFADCHSTLDLKHGWGLVDEVKTPYSE